MQPAGVILQAMRALPWATLDQVAPGTSLILAPHADDESLGCGGLIAASCARGTPPVIVCVTDGAASHPGSVAYPPVRLKALRQAEMRAACAILGVGGHRVHFLGLPDAAAPRDGGVFDDAVDGIVALVRRHGVTRIFSTWRHDPHCDHEAVAAMAMAAARVAGVIVRFYPVWGWLLPEDCGLPGGPVRGCRLDVEAALAVKRAAIAAHASQYSGLIDDSPAGFRLPAALLSVFDQPYEVFLEP
jgi:LmbE family N-acetylglucosaminyl deacetylase